MYQSFSLVFIRVLMNAGTKSVINVEPANLPAFVIAPNVLSSNNMYEITTRLTRLTTSVASTMVRLKENSAPRGGTCSSELSSNSSIDVPLEGSGMISGLDFVIYRVGCSGWLDIDIPITYEVVL